ncbi:MAG: hypothetical protein ABWZ66_09660 [Pyrinomonadaceae bacterium]
MLRDKKYLHEREILSALVGLLLNFALIVLLIGVFWYVYMLVERDFLPGFVEISRTSGNVF